MMMTRILGIGLCLCLCGGCATLVRGKRQKIHVHTAPTPATLSIDGKTYPTPTTIELERKKPYEATISAPGYRSIIFDLKSQWDGLSMMNILLPGTSITLTTDTLNGADRAFYPLAEIKLAPDPDGKLPALRMVQYRTHLYTQDQYDHIIQQEREDRTRFMGYYTP